MNLTVIACITLISMLGGAPAPLDLGQSPVRLEVGNPSVPMQTAATVLREEVTKRIGAPWGAEDAPGLPIVMRLAEAGKLPAEAYRIALQDRLLLVEGADARGLLFGAGYLLRKLDIRPGAASLPDPGDLVSAPAYPIRGHQLGYRPRANSWDAWTPEQFDQHIRELAIFGANSIENIPFEDTDVSPHMKLSRPEMNKKLSEICAKYGLDYWAWTPATFDLRDKAKRAAALAEHEAFYADCARLDGIFFPGGDPGDNDPREVLPFLADLASILAKYHPNAGIWISLQGFNKAQVNYFYNWIAKNNPTWLTGLASGPGSPPIPETRLRLPKQYKLRHYPDLTHTVRCQYETQWWDPAFSLTLGRECVNPQPVYYAFIHNAYAPYTDGFLSYSDGVHDDVNKDVWSMRSWNPDISANEMMEDYARFFFGADVARDAANGILALEKNWEGPLLENGGVPATFDYWRALEARAPQLAGNWRWQMCLMRAYYDAYTRIRLDYERGLEAEANALLRTATPDSDLAALRAAALDILRRADTEPVAQDLYNRAVALFDELFKSIGLQTSVAKYQASGEERGCSLDFINYPLNNRWWVEDEFKKLEDKPAAEQCARMLEIAHWETPGKGGSYDDIGAVGRCPHLLRPEHLNTDPNMDRDRNPTSWWMDNGSSRARLSAQFSMDYPITLIYDGLDPNATYVLRIAGYGEAKPRAEGTPLQPTLYGKGLGEIKEFPIPPKAIGDMKLKITFDKLNEGKLNWRQQSRITDAWLIKQ